MSDCPLALSVLRPSKTVTLRLPPLIAILGALAIWYGYAKDANTGLQLGEDLVCGLWGTLWQKPVTGDLERAREDVATFCSGSPAIGSTPLATLEDLWAKVQAIRAAPAA